MSSDIKVRKVTQDVLLFVWFNYNVMTKEPSSELCFIPEISAELTNNLNVSVWMESIRYGITWKSFVSNHFERKTRDPHDYFFKAITLVTYFGLYCWQRECKRFINTCADLFCAFFEKEIRTKFENQGGWKHFNEYLEKLLVLKQYKSLIRDNKSPFEYFKTLQDELEQNGGLNFAVDKGFIGTVTRRKVETHKRAVSFAKSVADKISELYEKEFDEILMDFARTDRQVKAMHLQTVGQVSGGKAIEDKKFSMQKFQKEASQNIPSKCKSGNKEQRKQAVTASGLLENRNLGDISSQDVDASDNALLYNSKSGQSERVKNLLADISMDIKKLSYIIQSLCREHGVQVPLQKGTDSKV